MYEQLDIFSCLEPQTEQTVFNPIEEFAKHGSGFANGKKRIIAFFAENENLTDRANFLKKEYGVGGFGMPCEKPFIVHGGNSDAKCCSCQYYNENMENVKVNISYSELERTIALMIEENRYKELSE